MDTIRRRTFLRAATGLAAYAVVSHAQDDPDAGETVLLPLFPLPIVAFPDELVPLHIYEPRFKQLLGECRSEGKHFGISAFVEGRIAPAGTEVELNQVLMEYDDGRLDVEVRGLRVYSIRELHQTVEGKQYPGADVVYPANRSDIEDDAQGETIELYEKLCGLWERSAKLPDAGPNTVLSYRIGHLVGLALPQEVKLLGDLEESSRQSFLREHMRDMIARHKKRGKGKIA